MPRRRLTLQSLVTSKVFVSVTIGMGDFIHSSKAMALFVSLGLISCFIVFMIIVDILHLISFPFLAINHVGIFTRNLETY